MFGLVKGEEKYFKVSFAFRFKGVESMSEKESREVEEEASQLRSYIYGFFNPMYVQWCWLYDENVEPNFKKYIGRKIYNMVKPIWDMAAPADVALELDDIGIYATERDDDSLKLYMTIIPILRKINFVKK